MHFVAGQLFALIYFARNCRSAVIRMLRFLSTPGAEPASGEVRSELAPRVVHGLLERSAGRVEALRKDVDGDVVDCDGDQDGALMRAEVGVDRLLQYRQELSRLDILVRRGFAVGDRGPALGLGWQFAALPGEAA
ncbi:MAG: hypothetical protein ACREP1_13725, partial [Rhodanobacteraceae bacterium]